MTLNKLTLVAGLAALACAGASAQSVQIYGVMDLKLGKAKGSLTSLTKVDSGGLMGSRLGFRGTEDLGGGLVAKFVLEADLSADVGNIGAGTTAFSRISYVGLGGGMGDVRVGRDYTPTFVLQALYDPFGACCTASTRTFLNSLEALRGANVRANNSISYNTAPAAAGFRAQLMKGYSENVNNTDYFGGRVGYTTPVFGVDASWAKYKDSTIGDLKVTQLAGSFKIGDLKLAALIDNANSGTGGKTNGLLLGATYTYNVSEFRLSYSRVGRKNAAGTTISTVKLSPGLGWTYNLSKRTALYTTYAHISNSDGAAVALNGSSTAANQGSSAYDIGIRHLF